MTHSYRHWIATGLAHALMADADQPGGQSAQALQARAQQCMGTRGTWLKPLAEAVAREFARNPRHHTVATLADHIFELPQFDAAFAPGQPRPRVRRLLLRTARMAAPPFELAGLELPSLPTLTDLAAWLDVSLERLQWLIAPSQNFRETEPAPGRANVPPGLHYHALLKPKRSDGLRLIEIPKPDLKRVQRRLLSGLLDRIPVHECVHGFSKGRSVLTHAAEHTGQAVVICHDLRDFFNSIGIARIRALWRTLGYPEGVSAALAALCTARTPRAVRERLLECGSIDRRGAARLASPHLPQGAPTSPALANLCGFALDLRLDGLAWRFGARYSRYADDLAFSGPADLMPRRRNLQAWVQAIAHAEGFALHPDKTRAMPSHRRQRLTGVVVNERPNLERCAYDRLRAQLHALAALGCDEATRMRLQGQVSWASQLVCGSRARKLDRLLAAISS
ncbi:reverse transcriptase family protein [Ramlibacter sp. WS9]|uniref:reverse transcriptase family protein n=1 Tax=Ramlibacter sp. WS9 TaxID=1882741 RepID=UPI0011442D4C|nr:reverse transcriptase family protein [Ramlibacter sp. WS9]ROZ68983.1 RNA-directed DNA polymerase [Ramlibacter sp. WS9]